MVFVLSQDVMPGLASVAEASARREVLFFFLYGR